MMKEKNAVIFGFEGFKYIFLLTSIYFMLNKIIMLFFFKKVTNATPVISQLIQRCLKKSLDKLPHRLSLYSLKGVHVNSLICILPHPPIYSFICTHTRVSVSFCEYKYVFRESTSAYGVFITHQILF